MLRTESPPVAALRVPRGAYALLLALAGVVLCVAVAMWRGQDMQWDLQNYHRYVAWSWLHDRLPLDFAPAGLQSYFNPTLDLPMQWLWEHASARSAGALLAAWHGLALLFTWLIARRLLPQWSATDRLLLSLAGIVAPAFWGGVGLTTGDNASAVLVLAAVWSAVCWFDKASTGPTAIAWGVLAGALGGLGVGLKLTNACAVLGLGLAILLASRHRPGQAATRAVVFGFAVVAGAVLIGGWWHYALWQQFGNPFFPQFGRWFPSPLAEPLSVVDTRFLTHGPLEFVFRPLLMAWNFRIASELRMRPLLWPMWFVAGAWFLARHAQAAWQARRERSTVACATTGSPSTPAQQLLLGYVLASVVVWTAVFGIYRYTVPFETLMPAALALLWPRRPAEPTRGERLALRVALLLAVAVAVAPGGTPNWGHSSWAHKAFEAKTPFRVEGERPVVLIGGHPVAWVIPYLGTRPTYVGVATNFPAGAGTRAEIDRRIAAADRVYLLVDSGNGESVAAGATALKSLALDRDDAGCRTETAAIGQQAFNFLICPVRPRRAA